MFKFIVVFSVLFAYTAASPAARIDPNANWRIVGGSDAVTGQFPYIVSIRELNHNCGGSILNSEWILTAAHCLVGASASNLTIVAGSALLSSGGVSRKASKVIYNQDYDASKIHNDEGLIKLAEPLEFNDNIQPIQRETIVDIDGGDDVTLVGWGTTVLEGPVPDNLQYLKLKSMSVSKCQNSNLPLPVVDSQVCTLTKYGEGVCRADSGSPLVGSNGKQTGIVSLFLGDYRVLWDILMYSLASLHSIVGLIKIWFNQSINIDSISLEIS